MDAAQSPILTVPAKPNQYILEPVDEAVHLHDMAPEETRNGHAVDHHYGRQEQLQPHSRPHHHDQQQLPSEHESNGHHHRLPTRPEQPQLEVGGHGLQQNHDRHQHQPMEPLGTSATRSQIQDEHEYKFQNLAQLKSEHKYQHEKVCRIL